MTGIQRGLTVAGVLLAVYLIAPKGTGQAESTASAAVPTPVSVPRVALHFSGPGKFETPPFNLGAGNYAVRLQTTGPCLYYADLNSTGTRFTPLAQILKAGTATNNVNGLEAGQYSVTMNTGPGCPWALDLTPQ